MVMVYSLSGVGVQEVGGWSVGGGSFDEASSTATVGYSTSQAMSLRFSFEELAEAEPAVLVLHVGHREREAFEVLRERGSSMPMRMVS